MDSATLAGMCAVVLTGACLHRVAGLGLGMVVAPVLTITMGPVAGVTVSNGAAIVTSLLVLAAMRAHVDWGRFARLVPLIIVGSLLGALAVSASTPRGWTSLWAPRCWWRSPVRSCSAGVGRGSTARSRA